MQGDPQNTTDSRADTVLEGGKFRLLEPLAHDAAFYRAERIADFPQMVAVQLPEAGSAELRARAVDRLRQEQALLAHLHHPGIAALVDVSLSGEQPWLATEFIDGQPLDQYLGHQSLSTERKLSLFCALLDALAHAHQHLIVHGDLSFSHILVDSEDAPHLIGFAPTRQEEKSTLFAAPEQRRGEFVTTASDVFAAGALLAWMLTGNFPPESASSTSADSKPAKPPRAMRRKLGSDLEAILQRALAHDPGLRYSDASAFRADLHNYLADLPVTARHGSALYRLSKFATRNRLLSASLALLLLIVLGAGAVVVRQGIQARRAKAEAQARLADMQQLTGSLLTQVSSDVARLPGSEPVEDSLLQQIGETLDQMAQQAGDDAAFRQSLAEEYRLLSALLSHQRDGQTRAATAANKALALLDPLPAAMKQSGRARALIEELKQLRNSQLHR